MEFRLWLQLPPSADDGFVGLAIDKDEHTVVITGASGRLKAAVYLFLLLPQVVIVVLLWWLGSRWLTATPSFEDIVLNVVALEFILNLDEIIFKALLPEETQSMVTQYVVLREDKGGHLDAKEELQKGDGVFIQRFASIIFSLAVVLVVPYLYITHFQQVLPGYRWDVSSPCTEYDDKSLLKNTTRRLFEM